MYQVIRVFDRSDYPMLPAEVPGGPRRRARILFKTDLVL